MIAILRYYLKETGKLIRDHSRRYQMMTLCPRLYGRRLALDDIEHFKGSLGFFASCIFFVVICFGLIYVANYIFHDEFEFALDIFLTLKTRIVTQAIIQIVSCSVVLYLLLRVQRTHVGLQKCVMLFLDALSCLLITLGILTLILESSKIVRHKLDSLYATYGNTLAVFFEISDYLFVEFKHIGLGGCLLVLPVIWLSSQLRWPYWRCFVTYTMSIILAWFAVLFPLRQFPYLISKFAQFQDMIAKLF